jgi:hypothetical protein
MNHCPGVGRSGSDGQLCHSRKGYVVNCKGKGESRRLLPAGLQVVSYFVCGNGSLAFRVMMSNKASAPGPPTWKLLALRSVYMRSCGGGVLVLVIAWRATTYILTLKRELVGRTAHQLSFFVKVRLCGWRAHSQRLVGHCGPQLLVHVSGRGPVHMDEPGTAQCILLSFTEDTFTFSQSKHVLSARQFDDALWVGVGI